jgi:hypothetical protein
MAIDTYTNLKDAIRRQSKRLDAGDAFIDDFIDLAEEEFYSNELTQLRIKEMDTRSTATVSTSSRFLALPDRFLDMRRLKINAQTESVPGLSSDLDVKYRAPDQLLLNPNTDIPRFFTVTSQLGFERIPDQLYEIEMQYFAKEVALSDSNTTNAILTNYPSIYLYGSLWALWLYYSEEEKANFYHGLMLGAIRGANKSERKARYGNAPQIKRERNGP